MNESPQSWAHLAYQVVEEAKKPPDTTRVLLRLPSLLGHGASALEIAKITATKPDRIESLLRSLSSYRVLEAQPSGTTIPYASTLYYLSSEGPQFFRQVEVLLSSTSASGSAAF